ncbi:acid protease [Saccharata proteae CBS 121410]|uniref:Acid protease n=1 Tax=Saccharata proteae CBS 121410 TaxID=1314787 RepID=A0A9P4LUY1_9PEZI|nr:acid protease [Saccharata proteae CBS 121410]
MPRFLLLFLVFFSPISATSNCSSTPPIYVDIHKRSVHGSDALQYGSFAGVGTPSQNQSLWPSLKRNGTSVAYVDYCFNSSLADCVDATSGDFDPGQSSTADTNANNTTPFNTSISGSDTLHLFTHYFPTSPASDSPLPNFPISVATSGSTNPGILGMGPSSSLMTHLHAAGLIAARTYALYVGTAFDRAGGTAIGSNTFGGFDAGRFTGTVHSYGMDVADPYSLSVSVADVIVNDPGSGHRNVSLLQDSASAGSFDAKISTDQYALSLPYGVTQTYVSALGAIVSDTPDGSLRLPATRTNSTITVLLSTGFAVTIPNNVLFNNTNLSPVATRAENDTSPFLLGAAWLGQVYLMLDYEAERFHVAKAVAEGGFVMTRTWCTGEAPSAYVRPKGGFMATGAIGAVVGGGVAVVAAVYLAGCLWVVYVRRRVEMEHGVGREGAVVESERVELKQKKGKMVQFDFGFEDPFPVTRDKKRGWRDKTARVRKWI